jgi:hypothetical protein
MEEKLFDKKLYSIPKIFFSIEMFFSLMVIPLTFISRWE